MMPRLRHGSSELMRIAPLLPVAAGLVTGIIVDGFCACPWPIYVVAVVCIAALAAVRGVRSTVGPALVFVASAGLGGAVHMGAARHVPSNGIGRYVTPAKQLVRLRGIVADEPRLLPPPPSPFAQWSYGHERTSFRLDVEAIEGLEGFIPVRGRIRVSVAEALLDLHEGEAVEAFGMLSGFRPPANPGAFDWAAYNRRQGIVASLRCPHRENVQRSHARGAKSAGAVSWLRATARNFLTGDLGDDDEQRSLLEAMILGHRSRLDRRLNDVFIRAGCIHFLAVSGVHVVIVMFFARLLCRVLTGGPRTCTWAMLIAVLAYAVLAEPRPSIMRATVIAVIYCIARLIGRERTYLNWISATIIALALIDPQMVFDVGYQLSTAAVIGVSYLSSALREFFRILRRWLERVLLGRRFGDEDRQLIAHAVRIRGGWRWTSFRWRRRGGLYIAVALSVSVAAWLAAGPIVAWHFHQLHPWAPIASLVAMPVVTVIMGVGFFKLLAAAILPGWGDWLAPTLTTVDDFFIRLVERFASLPGATVDASSPSWWWIVAYYLFLAAAAWRLQRFTTPEPGSENAPQSPAYAMPRIPRKVVVATGMVFALASAAWIVPKGPPDRLAVTVLAVGAGSATVIELPDGRVVLYDAGSSSPYDVGANVVVPYLQRRGIDRIDRVYISHPNLDHYNGVPSVASEVEVGSVIINEYFEARCTPRSPSRHLLELLDRQQVSVTTLDDSQSKWQLGGATFERLWPVGVYDDALSANETSTLLRITFKGLSILFTGDIEDRAQRMLSLRGDLHADVLVLPHHGGMDASLPAFLATVDPRIVIRSSHQQTAETFNGLPELIGDIPMYNTADVGAVRVELDAQGMRVSTMSTAPQGP